jgi:DNA-binding transcriptional LysR family regulator
LEIRQLLAFVTVAARRNFTRAAQELSLTQPAVTRQVGGLESELGTKLMDRLGRRTELTSAGQALLPYAEEILRLADEARRKVLDINHGVAGHLSIGASSTAATYFLPPLLNSYRNAFPQVQLSVATGASPRVGDMVRSGGVDIGIVMDHQDQAGIGAVVLATYEVCLATAPNHPLARSGPGDEISLDAALGNSPLIVMQPGATLRTYVERLLAVADIPFRPSIELDNVEAIKKMIEAGIGISILPEIAIGAERAAGTLVALPIRDLPVAQQQIAAIYREDRYLSAAMRGFLDILSASSS